MDIVDLNQSEKAVGALYAVQHCLGLFIQDQQKNADQRFMAIQLYKWVGELEITVDDLYAQSVEKTIIIHDIMQKYKPSMKDSNFLINYEYALGSLDYQRNNYVNV